MRYIGITPRLLLHSQYNEVREALALDWGKLFIADTDSKDGVFYSYLPLVLDYNIPFAYYAQDLCGVILSGGNDLSEFCDDSLSKMRDAYEYTIIKYCITNFLPLLGVCRGAQIIARYFDSTLRQCDGHVGLHTLKDLRDSQDFLTNSYHRYCIDELGQELIALAEAQDLSIESFRHRSLAIFGVMWHIEREKGLQNRHILDLWLDSLKKRRL